MPKFMIRYGLGGGMGGCGEWEEIEADDMSAAEVEAYERACESYASYEGMYGLRCVDDIMEEDDVDEDEAYQMYLEERESWLDYEAKEV